MPQIRLTYRFILFIIIKHIFGIGIVYALRTSPSKSVPASPKYKFLEVGYYG